MSQLHQVALTYVKSIGPTLAKMLVSHFGDAESVFKATPGKMLRVPGIGERIIRQLNFKEALNKAEDELRFIEKNDIGVIFYTDSAYPKRLKNCSDSPVLLFSKGNTNLNVQHVVSIVGTRSATEYGKQLCRQLVEELQQYRSEFFGKLRSVLANRPGITVVGDRFVFQSEVLFPVGSAEMTPAGVAQMTALAITIKDIASEIPADVRWVLRVDGHTDPQPVKGGAFASNWELSAGRAITVVKLLIGDGVPADHLAATAFGEYQPFGPGDTQDAYAKDRRIELRLTDR